MADWALPTTSTAYLNVLSELDARLDSSATMFIGSSDTNIPTNTVRYNTSNKKFELWNGSTWSGIQETVYDHIASTSNPHSTTAAQVGAPTTTDFNNHTSNTSNPHSVTAAQVGSPTTAAFTAHTGNTSNPHSVTAAQVAATAIANNLSELSATAATARTNIGAASEAILSAHTSNTSNPHNTSLANIVGGPAAKAGVNTDITQLTAVTAVKNSAGTTILDCGSGAYVLVNVAGTTRVRFENDKITPVGSTMDLGSTSVRFNNLYLQGKLRRHAGVGSWTFFPSQPVSINSVNSELTLTSSFDTNAQNLLRATARAVNQIAQWQIDHGIADQF